jgi:hypothetical protein
MDYIANMPTLQILTSIAAVSLGYVLYWASHYGQRAPNMPPGPPTLPVIGNANIMPRERLHLKFTEWCESISKGVDLHQTNRFFLAKVYGDVFSLKVFNQTIIVLNSPTIVKEVIDIRSASSSNRPKSILADMITPHNMNMGTGHLGMFRSQTEKNNIDMLCQPIRLGSPCVKLRLNFLTLKVFAAWAISRRPNRAS